MGYSDTPPEKRRGGHRYPPTPEGLGPDETHEWVAEVGYRDPQLLYHLHEDKKLTTGEIARMWDVSSSTVTSWGRRAGMSFRGTTSWQGHRLRTLRRLGVDPEALR